MQRTVAFRKVAFEKDAELIHSWMLEEHVHPFWHLNIPFSEYKEHLQKAINDQHQSLYIGFLDDRPMSYWEAYWVKGDVVEDTYSPMPYDQGVHLLIGEQEFLGKGLSLPLLRAMVQYQFQESMTNKVIAEPDIQNEKMIHVFKKCGFKPIKPIELPDKTGLLMFCDRNDFEKRWPYDKLYKQVN
ncbi:GNAT family N-acetyltransferase [Halobacillus salinarum]|uniref:GNAT family N-acetyltransferase n=1 Tax=Halobacillus salinarum TaxID=2932257 RepID=UPI0037C188F1